MDRKSSNPSEQTIQQRILASFLLLWLVGSFEFFDESSGEEDSPRTELVTTINPNTAPWWELMILPGIGPSLARQIISYRQNAVRAGEKLPVFHSASDLDRVKGICPKTVLRLAPYLHFHSPPSGSALGPQTGLR